MAFTKIAYGVVGSNTSPSITGFNATGADLIVLAMGGYSAGVISTPTDTQSNVYTAMTNVPSAGDAFFQVRMFYKLSPSTSGSMTISGTAGQFTGMAAIAFSGSAGAFNNESNNKVNGTSPLASGSLGASTNLIVSALGTYDGVTGIGFTSPAGYTSESSVAWSSGLNFGMYLAWKEVSAAENPTWGWTGSGNEITVSGSFTGTGGGVSPVLIPGTPLNLRQAVKRAAYY